MKILYFGTVCDINNYNKILEKCKVKPSVSTIVFESAMLEGFKENEAELEIHSFPMIPAFPQCSLLHFGNNKEQLKCGYECKWLNTINIPVLKQLSRRISGKRAIKKWIKNNREDGVIFTYSIPPFLAKDVIKLSKKNFVKTFAIIPDLLRDMYINEKSDSIITKLKNKYLSPALKLQGEYDGYIYLTEGMKDIVAPDKPYIVMEGIADVTTHKGIKDSKKSEPKAIMYAGMLHEKYGIMNLIEAFKNITDKDTELWLFGNGTAADKISRIAENYKRIKYFGTVNRDKILDYERKATLLVNPRDPHEEFTKYSFPSKTIEYMLSGTPVLTTKLPGIPDEYYNYVFSATDNSAETLTLAINNALNHSHSELSHIGLKARDFIIENKNSANQIKRVINFFEEVKKRED